MRENSKIEALRQGGGRLLRVRDELVRRVKPGVSSLEIDQVADQLIKKAGGEPSFKTVRNYKWATCINVNEGVVHGIPKGEVVFCEGDVISIDVGMKYKGYHTDTSITVGVGKLEAGLEKFLAAGALILEEAISKALPGARVGEISKAIGEGLERKRLSPVRALTGHGIGRQLHESPYIPMVLEGPVDKTLPLRVGDALAIEVIYTLGSGEVKLSRDGWTIVTADGKIAGIFEETVVIKGDGHIVVTRT